MALGQEADALSYDQLPNQIRALGGILSKPAFIADTPRSLNHGLLEQAFGEYRELRARNYSKQVPKGRFEITVSLPIGTALAQEADVLITERLTALVLSDQPTGGFQIHIHVFKLAGDAHAMAVGVSGGVEPAPERWIALHLKAQAVGNAHAHQRFQVFLGDAGVCQLGQPAFELLLVKLNPRVGHAHSLFFQLCLAALKSDDGRISSGCGDA